MWRAAVTCVGVTASPDLLSAVAQAHGGAISCSGTGKLFLVSSTIANCRADVGGGLYAKEGAVTLMNGTLFRDNSAFEGATIFVSIADVIYLLPVPAGHFVSASLCSPTWVPCPTSVCKGGCTNNISLVPAASYTGEESYDSCPIPPYHIQSCPWSEALSATPHGIGILGQTLETLRPGLLDQPNWPIPCSPGIRGATTENLAGQTGAFCAGFCATARI